MRMTLLHRRGAHLDEARLGAQLLDVPGPTIPHAGPEPADELVDERRQVALVRHAALDPLGHQLAAVALRLLLLAVGLPVAVARTGHHRPDRTHAAVRLEAAPLVDDGLPRALGQARQQPAQHDRVGPGRDGLADVARVADAAVRDDRHAAADEALDGLVNRGDLRHAHARDDARCAD